MSSNWLDNMARRIANTARAPGFEVETDDWKLTTAPEPPAVDKPSRPVSLLSRRASLKWALGAAAALTAAVTTEASTGVAAAELTGADDYIITAVDELLETNELFGTIGAALVFYEAADVLGGDEPPSAAQCEPDQTFCPCYGGFCLVAGDCSSYCS
jgi:hypothetical protein